MSKIEHETTTTALTVMEAIQNLIKPPPLEGEILIMRPTNTKHPYYKRPGRGHNHDLCDACEEGGDLLCCDRCPSSFHLQCHDPPLNEEDIPSGSWMCHTCRMTLTQTPTASKASSVERAQSLPSISSNGNVSVGTMHHKSECSRPSTPLNVGSDGVSVADLENIPLKLRNLRKRTNSRAASICPERNNGTQAQTGKYLSKMPLGMKKALDPNKKPTPLDELIKAASVLNPKQFELPRELEVHMQFPGNDKIEPVRTTGNGNKKANNVRRNSKPYELDSQGLVPLPARTCFYCKKSCKRAPLVACDYCALLYHQDCLDPPLTSLPTGIWRCPNHAENFADEKLLSSISVTERVRLYDKLAQPLDREAVKMEFFRRVHTDNPPFRIKVPIENRSTIEIPEWVRYHYKHPPPLLPSLREALRFNAVKRKVCLNINDAGSVEQFDREKITMTLLKDLELLKIAKVKYREACKEVGIEVSCSEEEQTDDESETLEQQIETQVAEHLVAEVQQSTGDSMTGTKRSGDDQITANKCSVKKRRKTLSTSLHIIDLDSVEHTVKETIRQEICNENERKVEIEIKKEEDKSNANDDEDDDNDDDKCNLSRAQVDAELAYLDVDLIKKLAMQRLQQVIKDYPEIVAQYQNRKINKRLIEIANDNSNELPSAQLQPDDVRRLSIMFTGERSSILATQQQQVDDKPQLHPALATAAAIVAADDAEQKYTPRLRTDNEKSCEIAMRLEPQIIQRKIRTRAVLTPLGDLLEYERWFSPIDVAGSFFMRYRQLHIGYGVNAASPMDLDLSLVGQCSRVSAKHATIFYDEYTKLFELINYSEYGSEVNGQMYSCDFKEPTPTPAKRLKNDDTELQRRVEEILDRRRGIERQFIVEDKQAKMAAPAKPTCKCSLISTPTPMLSTGWEGAAVLNHGALLRFGCLSFVFSIPDINFTNEQG